MLSRSQGDEENPQAVDVTLLRVRPADVRENQVGPSHSPCIFHHFSIWLFTIGLSPVGCYTTATATATLQGGTRTPLQWPSFLQYLRGHEGPGASFASHDLSRARSEVTGQIKVGQFPCPSREQHIVLKSYLVVVKEGTRNELCKVRPRKSRHML